MLRSTTFVALAFALSIMASHAAANSQSLEPAVSCQVTTPNGIGLGHGTQKLSTLLMNTIVFKPGGPGEVLPEGSLRWPKWPWRRGVKGDLNVKGRRLDAPAEPMRAYLCNKCYGDFGFIPMSMDFPTTGCWEITGRVGDETLKFVVSVIKIGEGPNGRPLS